MSDESYNRESQEFHPRMSPNTPGKLKYGRTLLIGFAFMASVIFWDYYNFVMPLILKDHFRIMGVDLGIDTLVGSVMVLDNILAIIATPFFSDLSDRTKSKFGRRTPYIIIGASSSTIAFSVIGFISRSKTVAAFIGLISVIFWFNISMALYRGCSVSLMPDLTDPEVRSTGNAIINLMGAVSMIIGLAVRPLSGLFFDTSTVQGLDGARALGFYILSVIACIVLILLVTTVKETPTGRNFLEIGDKAINIDPITLEYQGEKQDILEKESIMDVIKEIFISEDKSTLFMLLVIFSWFFGFNAIRTFYSLFATNTLGLTEESASLALMITPVTMILFALFAGKLAETFGRKKVIFAGLIGLTSALIIMPFLRTFLWVLILFAFVGIFYGCININTIVIVWEKAPKGKIGAFTGAYYFFSQLSDTLSPVFAGGMFDIYRWITKVPEGEQYATIFVYAIIFELLAMVFLSQVKGGEAPSFKEGKEEWEDDKELGTMKKLR